MSKKWADIGMITVNKTKTGDMMTKLVLNEGVQILVNGEPVKINEYTKQNGEVEYSLIARSTIQEVENLYKAQQIPENKIEARRESAKNAAKWCKGKLSAPLQD